MKKTAHHDGNRLQLRREGIRVLTPSSLEQANGGWIILTATIVATTAISICSACCTVAHEVDPPQG